MYYIIYYFLLSKLYYPKHCRRVLSKTLSKIIRNTLKFARNTNFAISSFKFYCFHENKTLFTSFLRHSTRVIFIPSVHTEPSIRFFACQTFLARNRVKDSNANGLEENPGISSPASPDLSSLSKLIENSIRWPIENFIPRTFPSFAKLLSYSVFAIKFSLSLSFSFFVKSRGRCTSPSWLRPPSLLILKSNRKFRADGARLALLPG